MNFEKQNNELFEKISKLMSHVWSNGYDKRNVDIWLSNFDGSCFDKDYEKFLALFLLSHFLYFNQDMVRQMLAFAYTELFVIPLKQKIRKNLNNTLNSSEINKKFLAELESTLFIGAGNPSESGTHLLYFFRQINHLSKDQFSDFYGMFTEYPYNVDSISMGLEEEPYIELTKNRNDINRLVFFDDLIGSGTQMKAYLQHRITAIREIAPEIQIQLISLFATEKGLKLINSKKMFDGNARSLFLLDDSFKVFHEESRNFKSKLDSTKIEKEPSLEDLEKFCKHYGEKLCEREHALGYKNNQLMIGFSYNTPDNTLPIFWCNYKGWKPIFPRFNKIY